MLGSAPARGGQYGDLALYVFSQCATSLHRSVSRAGLPQGHVCEYICRLAQWFCTENSNALRPTACGFCPQPTNAHTHHLQDHDCMCMKKTPPRALPTPAKRDFCCVSVESVAHGWCVGSARPLCLHGCVNLECKASRSYARAPCADILEHQG